MGALDSNALKRRSRAGGVDKLVAVVCDATSEKAVKDVIADQAMRTSEVTRGTLDDAISMMRKATVSPRVLIVDISGLSMPVSDLMRLAEVVDPSATVIVVGERNDVGLYRSLLQIGVHDYLVKPLTVDLLRRSIASTDPGEPARMGKAVTFVGARGGVGTTTIATALARHLAGKTRRRVAYIDLDQHGGPAASMFGVASGNGLMELLDNTQRLDRQLVNQAFIAFDERLFVLASEVPVSQHFAYRPGSLTDLIAALKPQFHYILLDLPQRAGRMVEDALDASAIIHVVADQSIHSVREAARLCRFARARDSEPAVAVLLNAARQPVPGRVDASDFVAALEREPVHTLPYEAEMLAIAESLGEAPADPERSAFSRSIVSIANAITGSEPQASSPRRWYQRWLPAHRRS